VYLPNLKGGFSAEKWPDDKLTNGKDQKPALEYDLLPGDERLEIAVLTRLCPPPKPG
jgi:hypothetical protein